MTAESRKTKPNLPQAAAAFSTEAPFFGRREARFFTRCELLRQQELASRIEIGCPAAFHNSGAIPTTQSPAQT
jgi:hypothetical protein